MNSTPHTLEPLQATGQDPGSMPTLALPLWSPCMESEGSRVLKQRSVDMQIQARDKASIVATDNCCGSANLYASAFEFGAARRFACYAP